MNLAALTRFAVSRHLTMAIALAVVVSGVAAMWGVRTAGGSDSYGYVSQADLWLKGALHIEQDFCEDLPWPVARRTVEPLGYVLVPGSCTLVPQYAPGLPLLMAAGKLVAGQCGIFAIVPLSAGVLVLATYLVGRAVGRPIVGLIAACLVAASPTVVWMAQWPMSDVPAAALWAMAVALVMSKSRGSAVAGGLAAALAILIRPNLVPLAAVIGMWLVWQDGKAGRLRAVASGRAVSFLAAAATGALLIGVLNARLYGSPLRSGYAPLEEMFEIGNIAGNLARYGRWAIAAEPALFLGLFALVFPAARFWPRAFANSARWLLVGCAAAVWAIYLPYGQFDAWWYLRFLLPAWPMMAMGAASLAGFVFHRGGRWRPVAVALVAAAVAGGLVQVVRANIQTVGAGESIYATVGRTIRSLTPPDAVVMAEQHSGTIRYYAGRMTLRWQRLDSDWLDAAADWLQQHGHHPYLLLERSEIPYLTEKYAANNRIGRLQWPPLVTFRHGELALYDLADRSFAGPASEIAEPLRPNQCWPPAPAPRFRR